MLTTKAALREIRNQEIRSQYPDLSQRQLALKYKTTARNIRKILASCAQNNNQIPPFKRTNMLTTKQISEIMNCGLWMARRRMENAGIKCEMKAFGHGRKAYWNITEDQVRALGVQEKPPTAMQQAAALSALEAVFGVRPAIGRQ